jgi:lysozyme
LSDPPCTEEQAEAWLREDVAIAERIVSTRFSPSLKRPTLTQGQFDALCSFVFNMGGEKFREATCTLLRWLNAGEPSEQVAEQFDRWVYSRDPKTGRAVKLSGLVARRLSEKQLFLSDSA